MIRRSFRCLPLALALLAVSTVALAEHHEVKMKGEYVWERSDREIPGEIQAVFTAGEKEGTWKVVFHFEWEGEQRAWEGEATGSLKSGKLEGHGIEERDRKRTFLFSGEVTDGVFSGDHGRERDGEFRRSGRITFSAE